MSYGNTDAWNDFRSQAAGGSFKTSTELIKFFSTAYLPFHSGYNATMFHKKMLEHNMGMRVFLVKKKH